MTIAMPRRALIGYTGFVGGNLLRQMRFDDTYNSSNIDQLAGRRYDEIYCAGAPGVRWLANKEPERDEASIARLQRALTTTTCDHCVLMSTVDVYPQPCHADEDTPIDPGTLTPYGRHRHLLEAFVADRFTSTIVRLPALFGRGIKKNVVYDFLHGTMLHAISGESRFQFYDLGRLVSDIGRVRELDIAVVNFATEPISVAAIAEVVFGFRFDNPSPPPPQRYDMRSKHAEQLDGQNGYLYSAATTLRAMRDFVEMYRKGLT
jgi:nucleoside-diphosphate-sugar epimerase